MIIGMNKLVFILRLADAAHGWKSSWKKWSFDWINVGSSPLLNLYIFDFAFIHSVHRKEVDTVKVKNGKDIIAQKEEGREREDREKKKNTFRNEFCLNRPRVLFPDSWGTRGAERAPHSHPKERKFFGLTSVISPYYPCHTHTHIRISRKLMLG